MILAKEICKNGIQEYLRKNHSIYLIEYKNGIITCKKVEVPYFNSKMIYYVNPNKPSELLHVEKLIKVVAQPLSMDDDIRIKDSSCRLFSFEDLSYYETLTDKYKKLTDIINKSRSLKTRVSEILNEINDVYKEATENNIIDRDAFDEDVNLSLIIDRAKDKQDDIMNMMEVHNVNIR